MELRSDLKNSPSIEDRGVVVEQCSRLGELAGESDDQRRGYMRTGSDDGSQALRCSGQPLPQLEKQLHYRSAAECDAAPKEQLPQTCA